MVENACSTPSCSRHPRNGTSTVERAPISRARSNSSRASASQSSQLRMRPDSTQSRRNSESRIRRAPGFAASAPAAARQTSSESPLSDLPCSDASTSATTIPSACVIACARSQISCSTSSRMKRSVSNKSRSEMRPVGRRPFRMCSWSSEKAWSARSPSRRAIDSRTRLPSCSGEPESAIISRSTRQSTRVGLVLILAVRAIESNISS